MNGIFFNNFNTYKIISRIIFIFFLYLFPSHSYSQIKLVNQFGSSITPKSIVHDGRGLFAAQNMMYKHTITFYNSKGKLLSILNDQVNLNQFGYKEYDNSLYKGAPVEACFTRDGKYLWVSNYAMYGKGFNKEGCDACSGKKYDPSFLYKISTLNYEIESVIEVGSVPKYITISRNNKLMIVSNWTSSDISIIDLETEKEIKRVDVGARPRGVVIDSKNQLAYVAIMGSDKIAKVNLYNFSVSYINKIGRGPRHLILSDDDTELYIAVNSANLLVKLNLITGQKSICRVKPSPRSMIMNSTGEYLYVVNYHSNLFQKINIKDCKVEETVKTRHHPIGITGNWSTNEIWVACYSGTIQVFKDNQLLKNNDKEIDNPQLASKNNIDTVIKGVISSEKEEVAIIQTPKIKMATSELNIMEVVDSREIINEVKSVEPNEEIIKKDEPIESETPGIIDENKNEEVGSSENINDTVLKGVISSEKEEVVIVQTPKIKMATSELNIMEVVDSREVINEVESVEPKKEIIKEDTPIESEIPGVKNKITNTSSCDYLIIVGNFQKVEDAYNFHKALKRKKIKSKLIESKSRRETLVSVGCEQTETQAKARIKKLNSSHRLNGWVLKQD